MSFKKNPEIIEKDNKSSMILFNVNSGTMFELNKIARLLWKKSKNKFTLIDLKKIIDKNCLNAPKNLEEELKKFIELALKKEIIKNEKE